MRQQRDLEKNLRMFYKLSIGFRGNINRKEQG
jgi:hypothetical protein